MAGVVATRLGLGSVIVGILTALLWVDKSLLPYLPTTTPLEGNPKLPRSIFSKSSRPSTEIGWCKTLAISP